MKSTIPIDKALIDPHPDNPRKDLGDLSELIEWNPAEFNSGSPG